MDQSSSVSPCSGHQALPPLEWASSSAGCLVLFAPGLLVTNRGGPHGPSAFGGASRFPHAQFVKPSGSSPMW